MIIKEHLKIEYFNKKFEVGKFQENIENVEEYLKIYRIFQQKVINFREGKYLTPTF